MRTDVSGRPGQQAQQGSVSTVAPLAEEKDLMVLGVVQGGVGGAPDASQGKVHHL